MSEPDDFVPEIRLGLVTIPVIASNFCIDAETGENPVMDAIRSMIAQVSQHQHQQVAVAARLICEHAGVSLCNVSEEELNFALQEAARVGLKVADTNEFEEIYRGVIPDNEGDGTS